MPVARRLGRYGAVDQVLEPLGSRPGPAALLQGRAVPVVRFVAPHEELADKIRIQQPLQFPHLPTMQGHGFGAGHDETMQGHGFGAGHDDLGFGINRTLAFEHIVNCRPEEGSALAVRHENEALAFRNAEDPKVHNQISPVDMDSTAICINDGRERDLEALAGRPSFTTDGVSFPWRLGACVQDFDEPPLAPSRGLIDDENPRQLWGIVRILDAGFPAPWDVGLLRLGMRRIRATASDRAHPDRPLLARRNLVKGSVAVHVSPPQAFCSFSSCLSVAGPSSSSSSILCWARKRFRAACVRGPSSPSSSPQWKPRFSSRAWTPDRSSTGSKCPIPRSRIRQSVLPLESLGQRLRRSSVAVRGSFSSSNPSPPVVPLRRWILRPSRKVSS